MDMGYHGIIMNLKYPLSNEGGPPGGKDFVDTKWKSGGGPTKSQNLNGYVRFVHLQYNWGYITSH